MAKYHIKKEDKKKADQKKSDIDQIEEYWRKIDSSFSRDLDFEEIAEINKRFEDEEQLEEELYEKKDFLPIRKNWLRATISLLIIAVFIIWISFYLVGSNVDWSILRESSRLAQDQSLASLRKAVVVIEGNGGNGSGFNIAGDGLIVTNQHVVEDSGIITIRFGGQNGEIFSTREWVEIPNVDLALIDIQGNNLPFLELNTAYPHSGDKVIFIGNPLGYDWTISEGKVISMIQMNNIPLIYLQGPILPGSSGSPLFNNESQVIGVIFAKLKDTSNQGLAIPISYLNTFLEEIYEH